MRRRTGGALLAGVALVLLAGCGAPAPPGATGSGAAAAAAAAGPVVPVDVAVVDGRVRGGPGPRVAVPLGATVRYTVVSDRADELHVHGYDRTAALGAGRPAVLELVADVPGVFEVELHGAGTVLPALQVR